MIVPFLFSLSAESEQRFLWVFYKYFDLVRKNNNPVIVMENYLKNPIEFQQEGHYEVCNKAFIEGLEYTVPTTEEINNIKSYKISNDFVRDLINDKGSRSDAWLDLLKNRNEKFEKYIDEILDTIVKREGKQILALLTFCYIPSLSYIAKKRNIEVVHNEIGPLRNNAYRKTAYFDFKGLQYNAELKDRYNQFIADKCDKKVTIFDQKEILSLILEPKYLKFVNSFNSEPKFELGISTQYGYDYFLLAQGYQSNLDLILDSKINFGENSSILRCHPGDSSNSKYYYPNIDSSETPLEFIIKCNRIATLSSNMCFEAMLWGKTAYSTSNGVYSFKALRSLNEKKEYKPEIEFINFVIFAYLIPYEFITDEEYIRWRLTMPTEIEIYNKHLDHYLSCRGIDKQVISEDKDMRLYKLLNLQGFDIYGNPKKDETDETVMINTLSGLEKIVESEVKNKFIVNRMKLLLSRNSVLEQGIRWHWDKSKETENLIEKKDIYIKGLEENCHEATGLIEKKDVYINELEEKSREVAGLIEKKDVYINELEEKSREAARLLEKKDVYINELEEKKRESASSLEKRDKYIAELEEKSREAADLLSQKSDIIVNLKNDINKYQEEIKQKGLEIGQLKENYEIQTEKIKKELLILRQQVLEMENTIQWKIYKFFNRK